MRFLNQNFKLGEKIMNLLNDKVAIVTGGTRGIGFSIVKKYLENGATVVVFGSREETVKSAVEKLKNINKDYKVEGKYPNLSKYEEVEKAINEVAEKYAKRKEELGKMRKKE